jgi:hypothetical protein
MDAMDFESQIHLNELIPRTHLRAFPGPRQTAVRTAKLWSNQSRANRSDRHDRPPSTLRASWVGRTTVVKPAASMAANVFG